MSGFNTIKKSRKRSHEIEEKLNVLNRELEKTKDIHEIAPTMSTSGIYFATINQANQDHSDFEAITTGGQGLGFSGADGNTAGNASIGDSSGFTGVALSPPHPVTGVRNSAVHITTGLGDSTPLRPGVTITRGFSDNPPSYTMGSCLWFFDSDFDNGAGQPAGKWCNLEYSNFDGDSNGQWFFWDTVKSGQFTGLYIVNTDLSQHPAGDISGLISGLNFPGDGGAIGPAFNTVDNSKGTGDADQYPPLPFGDSISDEAFDALDELAGYPNASEQYILRNHLNHIHRTQGVEAARREQQRLLQMYGIYFPLASNPNTNPLVAGSLSGPRNSVNYPPTPGRPHPGPGYKWYPDANYGKGGYLPVPIIKASYEPNENMIIENVYMALLHRGIKPTERDYIKRGIKTPEEKKIFDERVKRVESYVRKHPDKLEYVMKRYPKSDPRLSMLNYKMDKMTEASDKYLETQFPTNQDLFTKVKDRTKKNMNLTDPKNFKPVKDPIKYVDVKKTKKLKETVTRHFNKPVKSKSMFGLNMGKVRKTNQKMIEKREQEQRVKEEEKAYIQEKMSRQKSNWKDDLTTL